MRSTPTTALIAVISSAVGLLAAWFTPALLPGIAFGVLAYAGAVVGLAAAFRQDRDSTLTGTSLLIIRAVVIVIQTAAGAILHLLASAETALEQWRLNRQQQTVATPSYIHAA